MSTSILTSPFARLALRTLGMAPLDREFRITGSMENLERILLVDSGDFSDIVFFLPVISEIRRLWPGIEIHMMVLDRWADMLRREAGLAGLIVKKYRPAPRLRTHQSRTIHRVGGRVTPRVGLPARRAVWQRNVQHSGGVR